MITLIVDSRNARNIDPEEALRYISLTRFLVIATVYTACVFWMELAKNGPFIFSSRNTRSKVQVVQAHAMYLVFLFCFYRMSVYLVPTLPFWMTDNFRVSANTRASIADLLLCAAAYGMAYFERKWLFRECSTDICSSDNSSADAHIAKFEK
ncbi:MAG: hypothetical protein Q8902_15895 [Bacteroidota bacterium]|nr:hypothetical protein [Bacteroidota bacterium]